MADLVDDFDDAGAAAGSGGVPDRPVNEFSGRADNVVQAYSIDHVTVNHVLHEGTRGAFSAENLWALPTSVPFFQNRDDELRALTEGFHRMHGADGAYFAVIGGLRGVGKTEICLQWANRERERFPDGALYVDFNDLDPQGFAGPGQVLEELLEQSGVSNVPVSLARRWALYRTTFARRKSLIVLDNVPGGDSTPGTLGVSVCLGCDRLSGLV
jgi:hypothetical protein